MSICSSLKELLDKGTTSVRKLCYELAEAKVGAHGEAPCEKPNTRTIFEDDVYSFIIGGVCNGKIEAIGEDCPHTLKNKLDQFIQAKEAFDHQLSRVKAGRGISKTALLYCTPSEISPLQEAFCRKDIEDDFVRARDALDDIVYSLDLRVIPLQAVLYTAQNERVREKYLSKALMEYLEHGQDSSLNYEASISARPEAEQPVAQAPLSARTGSTKNKKTTTDIDVLAHEISKNIPACTKIKKENFMAELKKRCADDDVPFNETDARAAWKKFPQEQKYGRGKK